MSLSEQAEGIVSWQLGSNRAPRQGEGDPLEEGGEFLELTSALFIFTILAQGWIVGSKLMGPGPYNCQEAVAFRGLRAPHWNLTLLCARRLMNACLWGENPKQYSFLCLIYVNHESFHEWNKRHCERLVLPGHADSPTQSILHLTASARIRGNMPTGTFFFLFFLHRTYGIFLLIASVSCGATVHALLENMQPGNAAPAARRRICWSPAASPWETWRGIRVCLALWGLTGKQKGKLLWAVLLKK